MRHKVYSSSLAFSFLAIALTCLTVSVMLIPAPAAASVIIPGSIGDFVWNDLNRDGIQNAGESGISGVGVNLSDATNNFIASTTTDANGNYLFSGIVGSGAFHVQFILPTGYVFSPQYQGGDPAKDSNVYPSGLTDLINLAAGEQNRTIDAGMHVAPLPGSMLLLGSGLLLAMGLRRKIAK